MNALLFAAEFSSKARIQRADAVARREAGGFRRSLTGLFLIALILGAKADLVAAAAAPKVTFNTIYQINDNGVYSGFAANATNPDIGVISSSTPTANVVVSGVSVFTASAASTSATGTFQLQGNDVTGP